MEGCRFFFKQNALVIDWNSFSKVMQEIMDDSTYKIEREDFYFINGYSEWHDADYDDTDILNRLSKYLDVEINSYHADDDGVWFILK